jgi:hypothetical protein
MSVSDELTTLLLQIHYPHHAIGTSLKNNYAENHYWAHNNYRKNHRPPFTHLRIRQAFEVPVARLFAAEKKEEESFYRLSREDILILKKAVQILGGDWRIMPGQMDRI